MAVALLYFVTMGIVIIAEEIEEPFGRDPNDLPVDAIVHTIHWDLNELYQQRAASPLENPPFGEPQVKVVRVKTPASLSDKSR